MSREHYVPWDEEFSGSDSSSAPGEGAASVDEPRRDASTDDAMSEERRPVTSPLPARAPRPLAVGTPAPRPRISRRRRRRLLRSAVLLLSLALLASLGLTGFALLSPVAPVEATAVEWAPAIVEGGTAVLPEYGGSALTVLTDSEGGVVSDGSVVLAGSAEPLPMASITKVLVALMVLEQHPLASGEAGPEITFTALDATYYAENLRLQGSVIPLRAGQTVSLRTALEVSLIESANNWTQALANWAFGSETAFVEAARLWLAERGFQSTVLSNASGWQGNESTAAELVRLGAIAMQNPVIAEIVGTVSTSIPGVGTIENSNRILGASGVVGIKTGTLYDSYNLLFAARLEVEGEAIDVVGVILGAPSREQLYADVQAALDSVTGAFDEITLVAEGERVGEYRAGWGDTAVLTAPVGLSVRAWGSPESAREAVLETLMPGIESLAASELVVTLMEVEYRIPLELSGAISSPDLWWKLGNLGG